LAELLTTDLRDALRGRELCAHPWWLVWVHYAGETTDWIDAAWPTISAATLGDRAVVTNTAALHGWRGGWDVLDWTLPEYEVPLSLTTQQVLRGTVGSVEELDELMVRVVAALRTDADPTTIYIAADGDLERLTEAVKALPPNQGRELQELGLVPDGRRE
jgi:hypothetical protein